MRRRRRKKHWRTTLAGTLIGATEAVRAVADFSSLSPKEVAVRFVTAAAIIGLGIAARDWGSAEDRCDQCGQP